MAGSGAMEPARLYMFFPAVRGISVFANRFKPSNFAARQMQIRTQRARQRTILGIAWPHRLGGRQTYFAGEHHIKLGNRRFRMTAWRHFRHQNKQSDLQHRYTRQPFPAPLFSTIWRLQNVGFGLTKSVFLIWACSVANLRNTLYADDSSCQFVPWSDVKALISVCPSARLLLLLLLLPLLAVGSLSYLGSSCSLHRCSGMFRWFHRAKGSGGINGAGTHQTFFVFKLMVELFCKWYSIPFIASLVTSQCRLFITAILFHCF